MRKPLLTIVLVASLAGLLFASFSTYDFVQHLDRQVHGLHCSFIPGLTGTDVTGSSGCHVALMSPYSSMFRSSIWGGIPISLPAMAVFAFLASRAAVLLFKRGDTTAEIGWLAVAGIIPVLASLVMGGIAASELGAFCKLCLGIYMSSAVILGGAIAAWRATPDADVGDEDYLQYMRGPGNEPQVGGQPNPTMIPEAPDLYEQKAPTADNSFSPPLAIAQGFGFVILPVAVYAALAPDFSRYVGQCGELAAPEDPYDVMVSLGGSGVSTIEVFDPLCPSCKALEERLDASGLASELERRLVLFPLDSTCNWMVSEAIHPGACTVSEAVLCAENPRAVIDWAFLHQEDIRTRTAEDPDAAMQMVVKQFPKLEDCVGSAKVKSQINKSLRWAVANELQVLTPQVFVNGQKLCDEDTDLGLDYALSRLIRSSGTSSAARTAKEASR